jgi:hypothetical protein
MEEQFDAMAVAEQIIKTWCGTYIELVPDPDQAPGFQRQGHIDMRDTIADAGLVDESAFGLRDESDSVVGAALDDLRARLAGITTEIRDADDEEEAEDADAEDEATTEEEEA